MLSLVLQVRHLLVVPERGSEHPVEGKELHKMTGHKGTVYTVAFNRSGQAISCGADKTARIWDVNTGKELRSLIGHTGPVASAAFSPVRNARARERSVRTKEWNVDSCAAVCAML